MAASGEALVFLTVNDLWSIDLTDSYTWHWTGSDVTPFSPASVRYSNTATRTTLHDTVLVIPPKGGGKIRILSFESQIVDAGGY